MNYTVQINKLRLHANHGVFDQERLVGNLFEVTVILNIPYQTAKEAFERDWLSGAVNYADVANVIKDVMAIPSCLLENVAHRLRLSITEHFPTVKGGTITIAKLTPPVTAQMESAASTLTW